MRLRDRFLSTSTHDGTLNDAIRTLGWDWIAGRMARGDARLGRWLSSPISSSASPFTPAAIRWL